MITDLLFLELQNKKVQLATITGDGFTGILKEVHDGSIVIDIHRKEHTPKGLKSYILKEVFVNMDHITYIRGVA